MRIFSSFIVWCAALFYRPGPEPELQLTDGSGDLGQFVVEQITKRGGHVLATSNLPTLDWQWGYSEDLYGVVIELPTEAFPDVQEWLEQTLGPPSHEATATTDGGEGGWYAVDAIGVALHFGYNLDHAQLIIIRPVSPWHLAWRIPLSWFRLG